MKKIIAAMLADLNCLNVCNGSITNDNEFEADLIDTTTNQDAYKMIKAGLIDKCSFAFNVVEDKYNEEEHSLIFPCYGCGSLVLSPAKGTSANVA